MGSKFKLHIPHPMYTDQNGNNGFISWCKSFGEAHMAEKPEDVTCKNCLRVMSKFVKAMKKSIEEGVFNDRNKNSIPRNVEQPRTQSSGRRY